MSTSQENEKTTPQQRRDLWKKVQDAGGIEAYTRQKLEEMGFDPYPVNTEWMSDEEKKQYKEKKRKEAKERRKLRSLIWEAYRETHLVHLGDGVFYNDLVDFDRFDLDKREERLEENDLPPLKTIDDLAEAMKLSIPELRWLAYHREAETATHYNRFTIPKQDGSERQIMAPKPKLKAAQHWILHNILERLPLHGAAHGFLPGRSILTNAQYHAGSPLIIKMDLKDFFPTITFPRVKGMFRKAGLPEQIATVLALIATEPPRETIEHQDKVYHVALGPRSLPQGAPTSPSITNIICVRLDRRLSGLARKFGWRYTRYADDLTFSWQGSHNNGDNPQASIGAICRFVPLILAAEGFRLNEKKTRILRDGNRQKVTGLVINPTHPNNKDKTDPTDPTQPSTTQPRVPRKVRRQLRAAIHNRLQGKPGKPGESLLQLQGLAAFVYMTDPLEGRAFLDQIEELIKKEEEQELD